MNKYFSNKDIGKINEFRKEFMGIHYKKVDERWLLKFLGQPHAKIIGLRDDNNQIIAMAVVYTIQALTRKALIFEELIVDKKHRGVGIGDKLLMGIIKMAKKERVDCIECLTKTTNKTSQKLYKKFGFKNRDNTAYRLWLNK